MSITDGGRAFVTTLRGRLGLDTLTAFRIKWKGNTFMYFYEKTGKERFVKFSKTRTKPGSTLWDDFLRQKCRVMQRGATRRPLGQINNVFQQSSEPESLKGTRVSRTSLY